MVGDCRTCGAELGRALVGGVQPWGPGWLQPPAHGLGPAGAVAEDRVPFRKLFEHVKCISCDRPVEMMTGP